MNLYSTLPGLRPRNKTLFAGLGAAAGNGPLIVSLHAFCSGRYLLITGIAAVVRAIAAAVRDR